jgi:hypothetical protein
MSCPLTLDLVVLLAVSTDSTPWIVEFFEVKWVKDPTMYPLSLITVTSVSRTVSPYHFWWRIGEIATQGDSLNPHKISFDTLSVSPDSSLI